MNFTEVDIKHMERAIELAELGCGLNHPNPLVGAVVAKDGDILGSGYHLYEKIEHAETIALRQAGEKAKGATIYVNLEPCAHTCRTPPCTEAIIKSGISRVVYSIKDPDKRVCGCGDTILKNAGLNVESGLCAEKARELNRDYLKAQSTGHPWILIKNAMSIDGKIGLRGVSGEYFSSRESLSLAHELRAWCDAIMVGAGTVRIDNPRLTCRLDSFNDTPSSLSEEIIYPRALSNRNPVRIIVSRSLNIPVNSNVFNTIDARTIVITSENSDNEKHRILSDKGVEMVYVPMIDESIDLHAAFSILRSMGIMNIMVEGGGSLTGSLVAAGLPDELYLAISPVLIGGDNSPTWLEKKLTDSINSAPRIRNLKDFRTGDDILIRGRF